MYSTSIKRNRLWLSIEERIFISSFEVLHSTCFCCFGYILWIYCPFNYGLDMVQVVLWREHSKTLVWQELLRLSGVLLLSLLLIFFLS